ncbi:transmembrane protein 26b isoform X2 [Conger conger]|uniref:transmembrane protein 26b isoform X2 n=1 Tax=Conger conger TaxID=82655 RepID=UPI002A5A4C20|nr:transmembrane protein 26b isoform X2 [Conger conger]
MLRLMSVIIEIRKGMDYKWISPPIMLFLMSIIPSMWILELQHQMNKSIDLQCQKLNSMDNWRSIVHSVMNSTMENENFMDSLKLLSSVCDDDWILVLHQILLILLIVGKWLLPVGGGVTRDKLAQLLLCFVGTAADILEFTTETLTDIQNILPLVYLILAVWTWSMLQFPLQISVVKSTPEECSEGQSDSLLKKHRSEIWNIVQSLFIQDGPFLLVRLMIMIFFEILHPMLVFFTVKNFLMIILNLYYLCVICQDHRASASPVP